MKQEYKHIDNMQEHVGETRRAGQREIKYVGEGHTGGAEPSSWGTTSTVPPEGVPESEATLASPLLVVQQRVPQGSLLLGGLSTWSPRDH